MALGLRPLHDGFVAEIDSIDLERLDDALARELRAAFSTYAVLIAHEQRISHEALMRFAGVFGQPGRCGDITNLNEDDSIRPPTSLDARTARGNALWHTDMPVLEAPPLAAMLLAREIPPSGGNTQFADLAAAWRALPADRRRRLAGLRGVHSIEAIRRRMGLTDPAEINSAEYPPIEHPLICKDPFSGQKSMLFGAHTARFKGMQDADSAALLDELLRHATQERFVYTHRWRRLDLLMWNNRRTLHRVQPYDDATQRRRLWRAEVIGGRAPSRWFRRSPARTGWGS